MQDESNPCVWAVWGLGEQKILYRDYGSEVASLTFDLEM